MGSRRAPLPLPSSGTSSTVGGASHKVSIAEAGGPAKGRIFGIFLGIAVYLYIYYIYIIYI
jgi:hypothetical protein